MTVQVVLLFGTSGQPVSDRMFVMQVVVAVEGLWFAPGTDGPPVRSQRRHRIDAQLFAAPDAEAAYRTAVAWLPGFSDKNHDGPGESTRMFAIGLHQLEEVLPRRSELSTAVGEPYGVDVGGYAPSDVDSDGVSVHG
ncbi:hypothetical protein GobsT_57440 [Gemmata obscuriglobus]|nr:hypothetical protein GobsT_57440 [Gemmata obscuriglobus]VTS10259.1 Uncharacterized protein OS=Delftia acidovorans GN=DR66_2313 PE=4 SV=1 [Gemmata obscuriglobus UQM 2246]